MIVAIHLRDVNRTFYLIDGKRITLSTPREPDTVISGSLGELLRQKGVKITGNVEYAQQLQSLIQALDWEELLSYGVGDVVAHEMGRVAKHAGKKVRDLRQTATEYLQEEARYVPTQAEVEDFMAEVDTLRESVDRLEARIARLGKVGPP